MTMVMLSVVGARPNFVKIAPILNAIRPYPEFRSVLVHTEQHYSDKMSASFFEELGIPEPDFSLGVGSGTHAQQTARAMVAFEQVLQGCPADLVLLVGDVNSTLACALVAAKSGILIAHVEAGLRSFDRSMPEELNRVLTDQLADVLFTPSPEAEGNLLREGIRSERIHFVGNVMIDTLVAHLDRAVAKAAWRKWSLPPGQYAVLTLHRPSNVDHDETLIEFIGAIRALQEDVPVIFPAHPRTAGRLQACGLDRELRGLPNLRLVEALDYVEFLSLLCRSQLVLTDSGGVQEESTYLGIPCLTLRENTERPATVNAGTNRVVGIDAARILAAARTILSGRVPPRTIPPLWDGHAARRIVDVLRRALHEDAQPAAKA